MNGSIILRYQILKKKLLRFRIFESLIISTRIKQTRRFTEKALLYPSTRNYDGKKYSLGIIGESSFFKYMLNGYVFKGLYLNPLNIFKEVHYFQKYPAFRKKIEIGYPLFIHEYNTPEDIVNICNEFRIDIVRGYDSDSGQIAIQVANELNIKSVVSLH